MASPREATLNIGKDGISEAVISEIIARLKKRRKVRIKILKSALLEKNRKTLAEEVAGKVGADRANLRGCILLLEKRG